MISFLNDYNDLAHPRILEDMLALKDEPNPGYGMDAHCIKATSYIKEILKDQDLDIHYIHGGTMANILAIKSALRPYEGVISCDSGHILGHENGAIEASGHQIISVKNENGKLTPHLLVEALNANRHEYSVSPKMVYISNATEFGTVYTREELQSLSNFCKMHGLYLYMDGARLGTALASDYADYKIEDLVNWVDVFTIGGTKNGFLFGEALVIVNSELKNGMRKLIKQRGAMLAKGFAAGIQFETMFKDGLYFDLAQKSVDLAKKLAQVFKDNAIELYSRQESNLVFPVITRTLMNKLKEEFLFEEIEELDEDRMVVRFVTRFNNSEDDIDKLDKFLKEQNNNIL